MIRESLEMIKGVEVYSIISLGIFLLFFIGVIFWQSKLPKEYLSDMAQLPLNSNDDNNLTGDKNEN